MTNLSVVPYRNPLLLAKSAATLNRVSEGRFFMGAGAGYLKSEFFALGAGFDERNALFEESLEVMRLHWSGEPFTFEGRHFSARNIRALPAPREATRCRSGWAATLTPLSAAPHGMPPAGCP